MGVALIAGAGPGKTYVISANRAYQGDGGYMYNRAYQGDGGVYNVSSTQTLT